MRSTITITRGSGEPAYAMYVASASGRFGGGYLGAGAGADAQAAAAFAAREMCRYAVHNPEGGDLIAPPEVLALVPAHLHYIV